MNIIYDNTIFKLQKYGGIRTYFRQVIDSLGELKKDIQISLFKGLSGKPSRLNSFLLDIEIKNKKPQIYHPTYYSYAVKKRKRIKTVVTVFDMIHELFPEEMGKFRKDVAIKKQAITSADHIICISHNTKNDLKKIYDIDESNITVTYLGAPQKTNGLFADIYKLPEKPYILYVGKRGGYKNFKSLLTAFHSIKIQGSFDLVCFGAGAFLSSELAEFKRLGVDQAIRHVEGPDELLQEYYKKAAVFVYPSLYEGFGLPVLEAMSFGCVVIASAAASIPEVTGDAAILFSPLDNPELSRCIMRIVNDAGLKNSYIAKGLLRANEFKWSDMVNKTFEIYQKVLRN